jgi:hypothetical protein
MSPVIKAKIFRLQAKVWNPRSRYIRVFAKILLLLHAIMLLYYFVRSSSLYLKIFLFTETRIGIHSISPNLSYPIHRGNYTSLQP